MVDRLPNGLAGAVFVGQIVLLLYSFFNPVVCKSRWIWIMPRFGLGNLLFFVFIKYERLTCSSFGSWCGL